MGTERYWRQASWRDTATFSPEELWTAICEYFDWGIENPLFSAQVVSYQGVSDIVKLPHNRVFSKAGLMSHLGITAGQYQWLAGQPQFQPMIERAEQIIYVQKFEGAASGLFNATIVSRDLGLVDKRENTGTMQVNIIGDDAEL